MEHLTRNVFRTTLMLLMFLFGVATVNAQTPKSVKGIVVDKENNSVIGASVLQKGTTNGVVTDIDGNFVLAMQGNAPSVIIISYLGMKVQEINVTKADLGRIILAEDAELLDEVVVVSYGKQSKRLITGSVQSVKATELADMPVAQLSQKLQGKLAGVQINQITGIPGQGMQIRVRGQASISAGSDPLIVVDGFPINSDLANINPDEIETISILKDASASSLYGSRAANGVVLITTKRAKTGSSSLSVSAYMGVQQIPSELKPDMMNAREFAQFKKEIAEENGWDVPDMFKNPEQYGKGTDWMDVITRSALMQNYSINYTTSTEKFSTSAIAGYMKQEGVLLNSDYDRLSLRINSDYKFNNKVKIGFNFAGSLTTNNTPNSDGTWYDSPSVIQGALLTSPLAPWKNEDGTIPINADDWSGHSYGASAGPNWYNQVQIVKNTGKNINATANAFLEYEPIKGLFLKTSLNGEILSSVGDAFTPSTAGGIFNPGSETDASRISGSHSNNYTYSWLWENTANYSFNLFEDHNFDALAGWTAQKAHTETGVMYGKDYADNTIQTLNAAKTITGSTDIQSWTLLSFVARLNYNYKHKYLLSLSYRTDGSSKFGVDNRWGGFPSASIGWIVSEEKFMKAIKPISYMKLRASYGVVGNNNVGNYTQYASMVNTNAVINNQYLSGKSLGGFNNAMLGWENTKEWDLGVDFGFLNGRINFSYDYYHKTTEDLLYNVELPISSGFTNFNTNIGKLAFWGHEFMVSTQNFIGTFKWNTDFNIAFNDNKVLALGTANATLYGDNTINEVGQRIGQLWGLIQDGVYWNQEDFDNSPKYIGAQVGTIKYKDMDGSKDITNDERDKRPIGRTSPVATLGMTNTFSYRNFDLSIVMSGAFGHKMYNNMERFVTNLDGSFNVLREVNDRWRSEDNPGSGKHGKVISGTTGQERDWFSTNFVYDASYLTIKNITLGYTVPLKKSAAIKNMRVYGSIQQALVITGYPGNNPEASASGGVSAGIDHTRYPVPRTFTLGINLNF
ncbi:TonB-dependent receptor [Bacteroides sp.]|uniref:SusC/RagA family TonB-linked outer membrane protein n=1 Tax=Bacteroides sp. TaxID=29523 RepID=UPI00263839C5|nr:TonB-dependent receptor [Bacteroides sp.]